MEERQRLLPHAPSPSSPTPSFKLLKTMLTTSQMNILLIFVPLAHLAHALKWSDSWIFILNFSAIIPLARLFELIIQEVSLRVNRVFGGLLNATLGNAVELTVFIVALMDGQIDIVQASMLGSIASNLILVLGMYLVAGTTARTSSSSLAALACIGLIIPAAFNFAIESNTNGQKLFNLSHGMIIVLLIIYILYLYFLLLRTHSHLHSEGPKMSLELSLILLFSAIIITAFSAKYLVGSIDGIVESFGLNKTFFVGFVLLPIVGNAAELVTAVTTVIKNRMYLAINAKNPGISMQVTVIITPLFAVLGWIIGQETTLCFQTPKTVVLFDSVLMAIYLAQKYNLQKYKRKFWASHQIFI